MNSSKKRYMRKSKKRHTCRRCGSKKFERFMELVNKRHQGQWRCKNHERCEKDKSGNYR